jgi:hypothetical protein
MQGPQTSSLALEPTILNTERRFLALHKSQGASLSGLVLVVTSTFPMTFPLLYGSELSRYTRHLFIH